MDSIGDFPMNKNENHQDFVETLRGSDQRLQEATCKLMYWAAVYVN